MIEFVISDLIENISLNARQSILFGAVILVSYLILKGIYFKVRNKKPNLCIYRIFSVYLFLCYIMFVLYMVLLSREAGTRETVNLKIFGTYSESPRAQAYMFENILLLIPFGFLLPYLSKRLSTFAHALSLGMLFSLVIEIIQYITKRGYFQIDDIWLNTIGAVLGFIAAILFEKIWVAIRTLKGSLTK